MNIVAIVQARLGSTRLPAKVLLDINGKPLIEWVVRRAEMSRRVNQVVVATGETTTNNQLVEWLQNNGVDFYMGSEEDVLDRFYWAAKEYDADLIVRITADDPFKDPAIIDLSIESLLNSSSDYSSNTIIPTYPEGLDVEVFTFEALEKAWKEAALLSEREHVTPYIWKNPNLFKINNFLNDEDLSCWRWTVDHADDLEFARILASVFENKIDVSAEELIRVVKESPQLVSLCTGSIERNEGYMKSIKEELS